MRQFLLMLIVALTLGSCTMEDDPNPLAGFDPFMGAWTGTMPEGSTTDIMAFEWMEEGIVRHRHALGDGSYGGVTFYFWDTSSNEGQGNIVYHYFTTSEHQTQGVGAFDGAVFTAYEEVTGHEVVTAVRSHVELVDGVIVSSSEVLISGEWQPGPGFNYHSTPDAVVPLDEELLPNFLIAGRYRPNN